MREVRVTNDVGKGVRNDVKGLQGSVQSDLGVTGGLGAGKGV